MKLVNQDFDFEQMASYKLTPFLSPLFDKENVLRTARLESNLMKALKVESNARFSASNTTARFVDGYAVFWHISWTEKVTVIKLCFIYLWES